MSIKVVKPTGFNHRILTVGESGVGKTPLGLSMGGVLGFDTEGGMMPYRNVFDFHEIDMSSREADYEHLMEAIQWCRATGWKHHKVLMIDSISTIVDRLNYKHMNSQGKLTFQGRAAVNLKMKLLYAALAGLPMHVFVTARLESLYTVSGDDIAYVEARADADKMIKHAFHFIFNLKEGGVAEVWKARGILNPPSEVKLTVNGINAWASRWLTSGAQVPLWSMEDIKADCLSLFNAAPHLENTVKLLVESQQITPEMTSLQAIDAVREYVRANHPERAFWYRDAGQVAILNQELKTKHDTDLEAFIAVSQTGLDQYVNPDAVLVKAAEMWGSA